MSHTKLGYLRYRCNVCGVHCESPMHQFAREEPSCPSCHSTVRMRGIVHALSTELFGESRAVPDFPVRKDLKGIGLSDWEGYAQRLTEKLDYTNTYFHREPRLDITDIPESMAGSLDFIIASDVHEHIAPPVTRAFVSARRLLKSGGVMIFSVPYKPEGETQEHFPDLYQYEIREHRGHPVLHNRTRGGSTQVFSDLIFHGGKGSTLEMRVFSLKSLVTEFSAAGFAEIQSFGDHYFDHGIYWRESISLPLVARTLARQNCEVSRHRPAFSVDAWGPCPTVSGQSFNLQPDGSSAFWVSGQGFDRVSYLSLGGYRLKTTVAEAGTVMSAEVPPELIRVPRLVPLTAVCPSGEVFDLGEFTVLTE